MHPDGSCLSGFRVNAVDRAEVTHRQIGCHEFISPENGKLPRRLFIAFTTYSIHIAKTLNELRRCCDARE